MSDVPTTVCASCGLELEASLRAGDSRYYGDCTRCNKSREVRTIDRARDDGADRDTRAAKPCCKQVAPKLPLLLSTEWCGLADGHKGECAPVTMSPDTELVTCDLCKAQNISPRGNYLALHFRPGTVTPCRRSWPPAAVKPAAPA